MLVFSRNLACPSFSCFGAFIAHLFSALFCDLRHDIWEKSLISQAALGGISDYQRKVLTQPLRHDMRENWRKAQIILFANGIGIDKLK